MLVSGGINEENREVYDNLNLYDIKKKNWIGVTITNSQSKVSIGRRYMHSCTPVINSKLDQKVKSNW